MTKAAKRVISLFVALTAAPFIVAVMARCAEAGRPEAKASPPPVTLTFSKDIAPIIFTNCAVCHHPGGSAPFSLLSYPDVKKRAQQIVSVTKKRYMPPWLPEPGYGEFVGERRLTDTQISTIQLWVNQGAPEGDPSDLPRVSKFNQGWQLGEPDLVIRMSRPYLLRAGGTDVFRNFVLPVPVPATRYVRAVEIFPGNKKVVHHANILIDRTHLARRLEGQDGDLGFGGMEIKLESERFEPQSHFLFWKPGTVPLSEPEGMAWPLDKETDLVLNMHFQPSGKQEVIEPVIGLYFSDKPPTKFPMLLQLEDDGAIDIPAGKKGFVVRDDLELPVDVEVLGVYPHAHYVGKEIQGFATLPDGTRKWLVWIRNWDLNWQAVYRTIKPVSLPRGTVLTMRWTYDNTAENVRNPNHPPRRVVAGNKSSDEMSHLWIQVLPQNRDDLKLLQIALMQRRLQKYPDDFEAHFNLGAVLQSMGKLDAAIDHLRQALMIRPDDASAHNNLGAALRSMGKPDEALSHFRQALRTRPDYLDAHYNLGNSLLTLGKTEEAISHFREVLRVNPDDAEAHNDLGSALLMRGMAIEAMEQFEQALRINPEHAYAHYNLGYLFARRGMLAQAAAHLEHALRLRPDDADAHNELGSVYAQQGNLVQALAEFETALRLDPQNTDVQNKLARARAQLEKKK